MQQTFSYKDECLEKFGETLGAEVWEATNKAFDAMPIAAVVDHKVGTVLHCSYFPYMVIDTPIPYAAQICD